MQNLTIENFKAFHQHLELNSPNKENVLIYGENGSGKTSLFEAFRLYYFKDKIFKERIPANVVIDRADAEDAVVKSFGYDRTNSPIVLSVDGISYTGYTPASDNQVFLISYADLHYQNEEDDYICIKKMVEKAYFKLEAGLDNWFDTEMEQVIVDNTNKILEDVFYLDGYKLTVSQTGDEVCTLERTGKIQNKKTYLARYFNEAILHLVRFVVLMESIAFVCNRQKDALVVLDDCFNSLDASNRTFMMRYFLKVTTGMQKIVLTHNLSYYNLMSHILTTEYDDEAWLKNILCVVDGNYVIKPESVTGGVDDIITKRQAGYYANSTQLGNAIRQEFEVLIYRLSMLCNIGVMAESSHLLDLMCSPNMSVYFSTDANMRGKTAEMLVDEIYSNVTNGNYFNLQKRLKEKIEDFRANNFLAPLIPILVELRLLQKVALHQASHGHTGLPPVQSKEFDVSLALLKKIEVAISSIRRTDLSTV
jgi:energy-coupling factor transporter ATP-binding protein EcfA2